MNKLTLTAGIGMIMALGAANALAGDARSQTRMDIAPGGIVNVVNNAGSVNVHAGSGRKVVVTHTPVSGKIEVDKTITPDKARVQIPIRVLPARQQRHA